MGSIRVDVTEFATMESPLLIAITGQEALARKMDMVSNNIANMNTTGFKQQKMMFQDLMVQPEQGEKMEFVGESATYRDNSGGPLEQTGNDLDVALEGNGYFAVSTPSGPRYTRAGNFQLNSNGEIVTASGNAVLGTNNSPLVVPEGATQVTIKGDGTVSTEQGEVGQMQVVKFANEQNLEEISSGLFSSSTPPLPAEGTKTVQGMLEKSNVQPVIEMAQMIDILRSYQRLQSIITSEHDRLLNANKTLSRVS